MDRIKTQCTAKNCETSASNLYLLAQHIYDSHMGDITETLNRFSYPERSQLLMYITGMMKKDIAVVVKKDNEYKLHFIECKYFSGEGKYRGTEADSNEIAGYQTENQENIIEFLCDYLGLKYRDSSGMENPVQRGKVIKVQFVSGQHKKKSADYAVVEINALLK